MRGMLDMFGEVFEDPAAYHARQPGDAWLGELLASPAFVALVAVADGTVVGGLAAYELTKFEQERREVYIYDLAVRAAFRRRGIATALIERLRLHAKARGAYVIYVQADLVDEAAIALYGKFGVREDVLHFDIAVE